jgi:hypothetical protein
MVNQKKICAANISQSLISVHLKEYSWRECQLHVAQTLTSHWNWQPFKPSLLISSLNSLPSFSKPEDNLYILPPTRTYSKMPASSFNKTSISICAKCSAFSQISGDQTPPIAVTASQWMEHPFPQNPVNLCPTQDMLVPKLLLKA